MKRFDIFLIMMMTKKKSLTIFSFGYASKYDLRDSTYSWDVSKYEWRDSKYIFA